MIFAFDSPRLGCASPGASILTALLRRLVESMKLKLIESKLNKLQA